MSLKHRALLVTISLGLPQQTATDRKATLDAEEANNAHGAGRYMKSLYPKALITPITSLDAEIRRYAYSMTLPWFRGVQLLPSEKFLEFARRMGEFELQRSQHVTAFLNNFTNVLELARVQQGDLFDESAYPDLSHLRNEFRFKVDYMPLSDETDFRVQVGEEAMDLLRESVRKSVEEQVAAAAREPFLRLKAPLERIITQLSKDKARLHDSLTTNVVELCNVLPALNITNDPQLAELIDEVREKLTVPVDMIRHDPDVKERTLDAAQDILNKLKTSGLI